MNKMLRRKKRHQPYQPKKRKPSKRAKRLWNGEASDLDRYYAATDPRQLSFLFPQESDQGSFPQNRYRGEMHRF